MASAEDYIYVKTKEKIRKRFFKSRVRNPKNENQDEKKHKFLNNDAHVHKNRS